MFPFWWVNVSAFWADSHLSGVFVLGSALKEKGDCGSMNKTAKLNRASSPLSKTRTIILSNVLTVCLAFLDSPSSAYT